MMIIDGKKIAEKIISDLQKLPKPDKMLAAVLVGGNAQSLSFLRQKEKIAQMLEIPFHLYQFDDSISEEDLKKEIIKIGDDAQIGGIIVQLPLPPHYDRDTVLVTINPKKDIDAMTSEGKKLVSPLPVEVVKDVADFAGEDILKKEIAVVGRGFLVGKPIMEWLDQIKKPYKLFHSKTDLSEIRDCDLIITGVGKAGLIKPEMLKNGAGVIDFGYDIVEVKNEKGKVERKIRGDFYPNNFQHSTFNFQPAWYTPTPGGTGPILVAEIFKNFYKLTNR